MEDDINNVILFDGVCNLCNGFVNFVIDRDPRRKFKFTALQSKKGRQIVQAHGLPAAISTVILIQNGQAYVRSTAALRILGLLTVPWCFLYYFIIVPVFLRDFVYNIIATYRYKLFGESEYCRMPSPEIKERFLDWEIGEHEESPVGGPDKAE